MDEAVLADVVEEALAKALAKVVCDQVNYNILANAHVHIGNLDRRSLLYAFDDADFPISILAGPGLTCTIQLTSTLLQNFAQATFAARSHALIAVLNREEGVPCVPDRIEFRGSEERIGFGNIWLSAENWSNYVLEAYAVQASLVRRDSRFELRRDELRREVRALEDVIALDRPQNDIDEPLSDPEVSSASDTPGPCCDSTLHRAVESAQVALEYIQAFWVQGQTLPNVTALIQTLTPILEQQQHWQEQATRGEKLSDGNGCPEACYMVLILSTDVIQSGAITGLLSRMDRSKARKTLENLKKRGADQLVFTKAMLELAQWSSGETWNCMRGLYDFAATLKECFAPLTVDDVVQIQRALGHQRKGILVLSTDARVYKVRASIRVNGMDPNCSTEAMAPLVAQDLLNKTTQDLSQGDGYLAFNLLEVSESGIRIYYPDQGSDGRRSLGAMKINRQPAQAG